MAVLFRKLNEEFDSQDGSLPDQVVTGGGSTLPWRHYDIRTFGDFDATVPRTLPDFKYWNVAHFQGQQVGVLTAPRSVAGRAIVARSMTDMDLLKESILDASTMSDIELEIISSGGEGWPTGDPDVTTGRDATLRYANTLTVSLHSNVPKTISSSFRDNLLASFPNDGSTYLIELALLGLPAQQNFVVSNPLTASGNEITDGVRITDTQGDGRAAESSMGIWQATSNLITNGSFETNLTGWVAQAATITQDATSHVFGTKSMKVQI